MARPLPDLSRLRPAGGKHSIKRDRILAIFLQQEGHSSADDLFDLVRRQDAGIGRATVYRTLQWMVEAGHRAQGRFRRRPRTLRAVVPPSAPLSSDLHDLPPVVGVPQLGRRGDGRGNRDGAQFRRDADARPDPRRLRGVPDRQDGRERGRRRDRRLDHRARLRARRAADRDRDRAQRPRVLHARRESDERPARANRVPEARGRRARAPVDARERATAT